jgi:hypothetical protein
LSQCDARIYVYGSACYRVAFRRLIPFVVV